MIVEVFPIKRLPRRFSVFDYQTDIKLPAGALVEIPFRNQTLKGIVWRHKDSSEAKKLRSISQVLKKDFLSEQELTNYVDLAKNTWQAPSTILVTTFPWFPKRNRKPRPEQNLVDLPVIDLDAAEQLEFISNRDQSFIQFTQPLEPFKIIADFQKSNSEKQILILVPNIHDVELYTDYFNCPGITAKLSNGEQYDLWQAWRNQEIKTIVSTRQGALMINDKTDIVFVVRPSSSDFKQWDQNPRYDARDLALKNAKKIVFLDVSPRPIDFHSFQDNLHSSPDNKSIEIIDNSSAKRSWDFPLFSDQMIENITSTLAEDKKVLLFYNQKGVASSLACPKCEFKASCPECQKPVQVLAGKLYCRKCKKELPLPSSCPKCFNPVLKTRGLGNKSLQKLLTKTFPGKTSQIIDKDSPANQDSEPADILLVTQFFLQNVFNPFADYKLGLVGLLNSSPAFINPEPFQETETLHLIKTLQSIGRSCQSPLLVQTWDVGKINFILKHEDEYLKQLTKVLADTHLPPTYTLLRLHYKAKNLTEQKQKLDNVIDELKDFEDLEIIGPYPNKKKDLLYLQIRYSGLTKSDFSAKLRHLDDEYIIDQNPEFLA